MPGRPPNARSGEEATLAGRSIGAGLAPFRREISPRASASDLWATLETAISEPHGFERLQRQHHARMDRNARLRARAYLNQARQYYETVAGIAPVAKPLTGYYFALNLPKVFLTAVEPDLTKPAAIRHGLNQSFTGGRNYSFKREKFRIESSGVFRLLAERTGMGHCWAKDYMIGLNELLPYLPEGYELFAESNDQAPSLLPIKSTRALFGSGREAWLRIEIEPEVLHQRKLGAEALLVEARPFGDRFRLVTTDEPTYSYESSDSFTYGKMRSEVISDLADLYDATLVATEGVKLFEAGFAGNQ